MVAFQALGESGFNALVLDREAVASGQWWRLLSGHLVHWNAAHLWMNIAALALWVLLCPRAWPWWSWSLLVSFAAIFVSLGLLLVSPLDRYAGFSGVMHGLFVLGLAAAGREGDRIAIGCLLYLLAKVVVEQYFGPLFSDAGSIGVRVATESHWLGVVAMAPILGVCVLREWRART